MYNKLKHIQQLLWKSDDRMDQEILFELQDEFAELLLEVAKQQGKTKDLVETFPWLYQRLKEG